jgi:hypothetical protein
MQTEENKKKKIWLVIACTTFGGIFAALNNFKQGVELQTIIFCLLFLGALIFLGIHFGLKKKSGITSVSTRSKYLILVASFLTLSMGIGFNFFLNKTKLGSDWGSIYSAQLQPVPDSVIKGQKASVEDCITASAELKSQKIDLQKFCECASGNLALTIEDLTKKGIIPVSVDEAERPKLQEKIEYLYSRLRSLCYCEQSSTLPSGELCPKK